jgi:uncharacterized protein YkwD
MTQLATVLLSLLMLDTPVPVTGRCADGRVWATSDAEQTDVFGLINAVRAERTRPPLLRLPSLDRMAMVHAADMACRGYFDHVNPERQTLTDRLRVAAGGDAPAWSRLAEILGTSSSALRQVRNWLDSRAHRQAMLDAGHDRVGVGLVRIARGARYQTYWAVELVEAR